MQKSCAGIICHGSPGKPAQYNTDFFNPPSGQTIEQVLLGKKANYDLVADPAPCPRDTPEELINRDTPADSLILKKLMGSQACGVKMPSNGTALTQAQVDCFVDWINATTGHSGAGGASSVGGGSGGTSSGGSSSGGSSSSASNGIPATFETVKTILTENVTSCVGSDCHGGHAGRLNLLVNDGLLGRLTSSNSKVCGMPVVDPGKPENSALVKVLREGCGNVAPNCQVGTECIPRMPVRCEEGVDCIPEDYIKALEQWIKDGAKS